MDWSHTPPGTCPQARWALCRSEPSPGSRRVAAATAGPAPPPNWSQNWLTRAAPPGARACSAVALGGPGQARASGLGGAPRTSRPARSGGVLECAQEHAGLEWEPSLGWVAGSGGQGQMVLRRKAPVDLSGQRTGIFRQECMSGDKCLVLSSPLGVVIPLVLQSYPHPRCGITDRESSGAPISPPEQIPERCAESAALGCDSGGPCKKGWGPLRQRQHRRPCLLIPTQLEEMNVVKVKKQK